MKAAASALAETSSPELPSPIFISVAAWEEETFTIPVGELSGDRRIHEWPDYWENIEAIGAADDPARFKVDLQTADASGVPFERPR